MPRLRNLNMPLRYEDDLKLFRPGNYPVIRGTALQVGERHAFLWTSGYAPRLSGKLRSCPKSETADPLISEW